MPSFAAQLHAFADKTGETLERVDRGVKLALFGDIIKLTRVADPLSWKRPDPTYKGGTMRGNWQVTTGQPATTFLPGKINTGGMPASEAAKIKPFSETWLTNNTPYVRVYEEKDAMVGRGIADMHRKLAEAVAKA